MDSSFIDCIAGGANTVLKTLSVLYLFSILLWPLGIWKFVEICIWVYKHVSISAIIQ